MKIEKLLLEGGVRIAGNFSSGEPYKIERVSISGETRLSFPGMDVDYNTSGQLIYVAIRMTEFSGRQPSEFVLKLPVEFHEAVAMLAKAGIEIVAECDFLTGQARIVEVGDSNRIVLGKYDMSFYNDSLISTRVTDADGEVGCVGFLVEKREDGMIRLGVGISGVSIWVAQPAMVDISLLSGKIDKTTVARFLKGVPPAIV